MDSNKKVSRRNFIHLTVNGAIIPVVLLSAFNVSALPEIINRLDVKPTGSSDLELIKKLFKSKEPIKWVFAGDSITQGAKHTNGLRSYPEIFSERVRWEMGRSRDLVVNSAISGNTTTDVLNDFDWRISQFKPSVVSLMLGTNDAAQNKNISLQSFESNIFSLLEKIKKIGAIPIIHSPNPIIAEQATERSGLPQYIEIIRNLATNQNVIFIDHFRHWNMAGNSVYNAWLNDPLHPNGHGHLEMARLLFKGISIFDEKSFTCTGRI